MDAADLPVCDAAEIEPRGVTGISVPGQAGAPRDLPASLGPFAMTFEAGGGKMMQVNLDGFSHHCRVRRVYCRCPFHEACFKYCQLTVFPEPWQAVAFVVAYMRAGAPLDDKVAHQRCGVTNGDHLQDDMPAILFQSEMRIAT